MGNQKSDAQEYDLMLGRRAVAKKVISGSQLTELRLIQSQGGMKKSLSKLALERKLLTVEQVAKLRESLDTSGMDYVEVPSSARAQARCGKIFLDVLCDEVIRQERFQTIYQGRLPRDPEPVALQLIDKEALRHGLWMDFLETVRGCKGIRVRNLVEVIEVGRTDEEFGIVTRFYRGGISLRSLIDRVRRLKMSEVLRIIREIAQGVATLHAAGITHRDLKGENILLGREGQVQVMNAGIVFEPANVREFASPASVFGSPHAMAPECWRGDPANPASDIYALGVLGYELATGVRPFEAESTAAFRDAHREPALPPHTIMRSLPKEIGELLIWALAKDPKDRPNANKLVTTLQQIEKTIQRSGLTKKFQALDE